MLLKISKEDAKNLRVPRHYTAIFTGGAALSLKGLIAAAHVEETAGIPLSELFTGGAIGSSGGTFGAAALSMPKPDDPDSQLMTMTESKDRFISSAPTYIPHTPKHYNQHVKDKVFEAVAEKMKIPKGVLERLFGKAVLHYHTPPEVRRLMALWQRISSQQQEHDYTSPILANLNEIMQGMTLAQARRSLCLTSGKIYKDGSESDRIEPYDFYKIEDGLLIEDSYIPQTHPEVDIPIVDAIMASIACPTIFPAHKVEATGTFHVDTALIDTGVDNISSMHANLQPGYGMGVVRFGSGDDNKAIHPDDYNSWNAPTMLTNRHFFQMDREISQQRALRLLRATVGDDNVWDVNHRIVPLDEHDHRALPSTDPLDTSPEQLERIQDFMDEAIGRRRDDLYMPMIDALVENKALLDQAKPDHANTTLTRIGNAIGDAFNWARRPATANDSDLIPDGGLAAQPQAASAAPFRA